MLALVWFSRNGKEGGVRFCSKFWKSMVEGTKPPTDWKQQRYQQFEADRPDGGSIWAKEKSWSTTPPFHSTRSKPSPAAFYLTFWLSMKARKGRGNLQSGRSNIWYKKQQKQYRGITKGRASSENNDALPFRYMRLLFKQTVQKMRASLLPSLV